MNRISILAGLALFAGVAPGTQPAQSAPVAIVPVSFTVPSVCRVEHGAARPAVHCVHPMPTLVVRQPGQAYWTIVF